MRRILIAGAILFAVVGSPGPVAGAESSADAIQRARAFAGRRDYASARGVLEQALEAAPRDFAAHELLGYCLMKLFLFDEACDAFERGDATDRYHDINFGFCLRKAGRLPEALQAFKRAQFVLGPQDSWAAYCADQIAELEPLAKARVIVCLAQADDVAVALVNGKSAGRAKAGGEAGLILDPLVRAGKNEVRLLAVNTGGAWAYRFRLYVGGKLVWSAGAGHAGKDMGAHDNDETAGIVGEATLDIEASPETGPRLAAAREGLDFAAVRQKMDEAEALWKEGRYPDSIRILEIEAKEHPALDWFHLRLAEACDEIALTIQDPTAEGAGKRERLKRAAAAARERWLEVRKKVALLAVDDPGAFRALAAAYQSAGKHAEAEGAYKRALALDPNRVEAMVGLADSLVKQGKGAEARQYAEQALDRTPHWSYAHFMLGEALFEMGDGRAALAAYARAIDLDPSQGEWMYGKIALVANKGGANAAAILEAEKKAAASPADPAARKALGDALMRGLRYEDALRAYEAVLTAAPATPGVNPLMGLLFELTGRPGEAAARYQKGTDDEDEELRELARRRLARTKLFAAPPAPRLLAAGKISFEDGSGAGKEKAIAAVAAIGSVRPVLAAGLRRLPPLRDGEISPDDAAAVGQIEDLVQCSRARDQLRRGFVLIEREIGRRPGAIKVDGSLDEWERTERLAEDPAGDATRGAAAGADLAEFYAVVEGSHLALGWRAHGGARISANVSYWANVYSPKRDVPWIAVGIAADDVYIVRFHPDGKREQVEGRKTGIEWEGGAQGVEARVPLSWLRGERRLQAEAYTFAERGGKLDLCAETQPPVRIDDGYSPSLLALFNLAKDVTLEADDRPALAIALTSGDYYAIGDEALDDAVRDDDRRMLRFARVVKVWQAAMGLPAIDTLPMPALLFWANRSVQWRGSDVADYRRDSISPATLEAMLRYTQRHGWRGRSPGDVVEQVERFLIDPTRWQYTSSEMVTRGLRARAGESVTLSEEERKDLNKFVREVTIDGRKVNTDGTFNPDLQFDYLLATDAILGHCGNLAQTVVDFARAVGIPATICQGIEERSKLYPNPHAFPIYYDGRANVWRSFQGRKYKGIRSLTLDFFLPPLAPPAIARPTGGGSYWYPIYTTYDEAGPMFANGFEAGFVNDWMEALAAGGR